VIQQLPSALQGNPQAPAPAQPMSTSVSQQIVSQ